MRAPGVAILSLAAFGALAAPAIAQTAEPPAPPVGPEAPEPGPIEPTADRPGVIDGAQLQITSGTEEDNATFRIALPTSPAVATRFSLALSRPLDDDEEAMPASLDALANGTRVALNVGYFRVRAPRQRALREGEDAMSEDEVIMRCRAVLRAVGDERLNTPRDPCVDSTEARVIAELPPGQAGLSSPSATDFGLEASAGFNDFEWFDTVSMLPQEDRRTDWSIAGYFTHYLSGSHTALTASISYQRAYEAAPEERVCPAGTVDPEAECPNLRTAAPTRNENLLLAAGIRHRFMGDGRLANLAVAPIVTYDVIDDVFGVDVPIYYTPDDKGGLNGGIRFGYRSDRENEFSVAFFVGAAFDIFGGR